MGDASRTRSTDKRFYGVVEAIVTAVEGDSQGRIKVNFPWFDGQLESEWCRVCNLYAGNGYGACVLPEVGDEVLVSFIHGDMRLPIILGGLFNGKDIPPSQRSNSKNEKMIRTKAGHVVRLDDSSGSEKIEIIDAKGDNSIVIDTAGKSITVKSNGGKLVLQAQSIEIKSETDVDISANGNVTIKGSSINLN